jgi:hypothetical protein
MQAAAIACSSESLPESSAFLWTDLQSGLPAEGQWRDRFDLADMNGDGHIDLVHGPRRKGDFLPAIFLGDGAGHFQRWTSAHFPPLPYDYGDARVADFNRDGIPDVALASHLRGLTVLMQETGGFFTPWAAGLILRAPTAEPPPVTSRAIAIADWNRDGWPDLLALDEGPSRMSNPHAGSETMLKASSGVALYLNGRGDWTAATEGASVGTFGTSLSTGDVNGDTHPDVILGSSSLIDPELLLIGRGATWITERLETLPNPVAVTATALHDFDGNGSDEILAGIRYRGNGSDSCIALHLVKYSRNHQTGRALWSESSNDRIVSLIATDLDGDTFDDVIAARDTGSLLVFRGTPDGFTRDRSVPTPSWMEGCHAFDAHAADIDGDFRPEVIVSYAGDATVAGARCASRGGFAVWRVNSAR